MKKIIGGRFHEPLVPEILHGPGANDARVTHLRGGFATLAEHLHDIRPGARNHFGILCGQTGLGHDQVHERQIDRVILGLDNFPRLGFVPGQQTFLLAGGSVFTAENGTPLEQCESVLHSCLSVYGHQLKTVKE
jgi:hypothetical protein